MLEHPQHAAAYQPGRMGDAGRLRWGRVYTTESYCPRFVAPRPVNRSHHGTGVHCVRPSFVYVIQTRHECCYVLAAPHLPSF